MQPYDGLALLKSHHGMMRFIADELGLSRSRVSKWQRVPAELLPAVERVTGVPRWALRPDIVPPPRPYDAPPPWMPTRLAPIEASDETQEPAEAVTEDA